MNLFQLLPKKNKVLADINGDGLKDIVGFNLYNQQIAFADGNGGFLAPFTVGAGLGGSGNLFFF